MMHHGLSGEFTVANSLVELDGICVLSEDVHAGVVESHCDRFGFRLVDDKIGGWPERYFERSAKAHRPGLILVGESWGIDPLLGEGIAPSLEMARYAAGRLKGALDAGKVTKEQLVEMEERAQGFGDRLRELEMKLSSIQQKRREDLRETVRDDARTLSPVKRRRCSR